MKIVMYRYGSICEPDIIDAFSRVGFEIIEISTEVNVKNISDFERANSIKDVIDGEDILFVFSINFYPIISKVCHIYGVKYLCWTVDAPIAELYSSTILNDENRIFLFDREQYTRFKPYNPNRIYYLPLAGAVDRLDTVVSDITSEDRYKYQKDISFVGSLYNERDKLTKNELIGEKAKGYIRALTEASFNVPDYSIIENAVSLDIIEEIKRSDINYYTLQDIVCSQKEFDRYYVANKYIGYAISSEERVRTLNTLAKHFSVDLYTRSDTAKLENVNVHNGVSTLTEMPKVFNLSKINLNMTIKSIQKGIPLRIFDICGCGGFLMSNYQEELEELFDIGNEIECYSCIDELIDKCDFYLNHDEIRQEIAFNGYKKVKEHYTYFHRINSMIKAIV